MLCVLCDELLLVGGNFIEHKDRVRRANRHAGAAIDAAVGVNVKLGCRFKALLVLFRVNTISRAGFDAEFVFGAGVGNNVCHDCARFLVLPVLVRPQNLLKVTVVGTDFCPGFRPFAKPNVQILQPLGR